MNETSKTYFCTRPTLARELISAGRKCDKTINPFHPEMTAWVFELDAETAEFVAEYYTSRGLKVPSSIELYQREGAAE